MQVHKRVLWRYICCRAWFIIIQSIHVQFFWYLDGDEIIKYVNGVISFFHIRLLKLLYYAINGCAGIWTVRASSTVNPCLVLVKIVKKVVQMVLVRGALIPTFRCVEQKRPFQAEIIPTRGGSIASEN
jgi:hypothetical protein